MKQRLLSLMVMLVMILGCFLLFLGLLQFNDGFKREVDASPVLFIISLAGGIVLMILSMAAERALKKKDNAKNQQNHHENE